MRCHMKIQKEVTMREIAREAGVAVSTVSKALRNDISIPESRCKEIQCLARQLGYRPNPLVATLMAQLHHHRRRDDPHRIAWLDFWEDEPSPMFNIGRSLTGALKRSEELGYCIEVYRPAVDDIPLHRLGRILSARGHWAVIIPPVPDRFQCLGLDLKNLAAVTIGTSLKKPVMHRISPNHFQAGMLAFRQMRSKGFRRIGMILSESMNHRVGGTWLGAFYSSCEMVPKAEQTIPLLLREKDSRAVACWVRRERPDSILLADSNLDGEWLRHGSRRPQTIGWLLWPENRPVYAGVDYHPEWLGRLAVDAVVAQIHRNERGVPQIPYITVVDASWVEPRRMSRSKSTGRKGS